MNRIRESKLEGVIAAPSDADQVQGLTLDIVVRKSVVIFPPFAWRDEPLLVGVWELFFILDLVFYLLDGDTGLHIQSDNLYGWDYWMAKCTNILQ